MVSNQRHWATFRWQEGVNVYYLLQRISLFWMSGTALPVPSKMLWSLQPICVLFRIWSYTVYRQDQGRTWVLHSTIKFHPSELPNKLKESHTWWSKANKSSLNQDFSERFSWQCYIWWIHSWYKHTNILVNGNLCKKHLVALLFLSMYGDLHVNGSYRLKLQNVFEDLRNNHLGGKLGREMFVEHLWRGECASRVLGASQPRRKPADPVIGHKVEEATMASHFLLWGRSFALQEPLCVC